MIKPIHRVTVPTAAIPLATAQATLPFPPTADTSEAVPTFNDSEGSVPEFEIELFSAASCTLTNAMLWGKLGSVWYLYGPLNDGNSISLDSNRGFRQRFGHSPRTTEYGVSGTLSASTVTVTAVAIRWKE